MYERWMNRHGTGLAGPNEGRVPRPSPTGVGSYKLMNFFVGAHPVGDGLQGQGGLPQEFLSGLRLNASRGQISLHMTTRPGQRSSALNKRAEIQWFFHTMAGAKDRQGSKPLQVVSVNF